MKAQLKDSLIAKIKKQHGIDIVTQESHELERFIEAYELGYWFEAPDWDGYCLSKSITPKELSCLYEGLKLIPSPGHLTGAIIIARHSSPEINLVGGGYISEGNSDLITGLNEPHCHPIHKSSYIVIILPQRFNPKSKPDEFYSRVRTLEEDLNFTTAHEFGHAIATEVGRRALLETFVHVNGASENVGHLFANSFALSLLYPSELTPNQRIYFDNLNGRLRQDADNFLNQIARNPNSLLEGIVLG